jgi:DNA-binding LacI/PurR family transcriptional regulator
MEQVIKHENTCCLTLVLLRYLNDLTYSFETDIINIAKTLLQRGIPLKITIKDVAKKAGVSVATVSRVLNGKDRVKVQTREKILSAIEEYNFKPDPAARTMINKETKTIGLLMPVLSNEYWGSVAEVLQDYLWTKKYSSAISCYYKNPEKEADIIDSFIERRIDGIICCGTANGPDGGAPYQKLKEYGIPIVSYGATPGMHAVDGDHFHGAAMAVEHLLSMGHNKIAYLTWHSSFLAREFGYRSALIEAGIPVDERLIRTPSSGQVNISLPVIGYETMKQFLSEKLEFTALFCANDLLAVGAVRALEEAGRNVPEHVAVVGFDDVSFAQYFKPSLTTVRQPIREMGQAAVDMLLDLMKNNRDCTQPVKKLFQMSLVVRESSAKG